MYACAVQGTQAFTFSLVYTSAEEVLPQLEALLAVARLDDSRAGAQQAAQRLDAIIQVGSISGHLSCQTGRSQLAQ